MTTELLALCISILLATAAGGLLCCREVARVHGSYANIKCLVILNYILIQPVSGIVHLVRGSSGFRGYYDLLTGDTRTVLIATASCSLGMAALCFACMQGRPPERRGKIAVGDVWLSTTEIWLVCIAMALIAVPALNAFVVLSNYVAQLGATRVISLEGGLARYSFIANWLVWLISFTALLLVGRKRAPHPLVTLVVVGLATLLIAVSLNWTGGRSIVVLMALPLVLVMMPRLRRIQWLALPVAAVSLTIYVAAISQARSESLVRGASVSPVNWLDWEWGRFSLSGFASEYTSQYGLLYGETFLRGITSAVLAPLNFVGLPVPDLGLRSTVEISGEVLLGNSELIYIVPGLNAELYMNFGLPGVVVGYYILGRVCVLVDKWLVRATSLLERLAISFLGAVLVLRTIPSDSGTLYVFIFYTGLPLLVCALMVRWLYPRAAYKLRLARKPRVRGSRSHTHKWDSHFG